MAGIPYRVRESTSRAYAPGAGKIQDLFLAELTEVLKIGKQSL